MQGKDPYLAGGRTRRLSSRTYLWDSWVEQTKAMAADGVITYKAPKGLFRKQFKRLNKQTDLTFQRVKNDRDADIICEYAQVYVDGSYTTRRYDGSYLVQVDPLNKGRRNLEAHEIGHSLGLFDSERAESVMNPENATAEERRFLSPIDRLHIQNLLLDNA